MAEGAPQRAGSWPTPLLLAAASVSLSVCAAAVGGDSAAGCGAAPDGLPDVRLHLTTPQGAAETYLDAWRKRRYDVATEVSVGPARGAAAQRARVEPLLEDDAVLKLWRELARHRLELDVRETEYPAPERVVLRGLAQGTLADHPYEREIAFETVQRGASWRVARMELGRILRGPPFEHLRGLE